MDDIVIEAARRRLTLSGRNGAILSLLSDGEELLLPAQELFTLHFRSGDRELFPVSGSEFPAFGREEERLVFADNGAFPSLRVEIELKTTADGFFLFRPSVLGIPEGITLELVDLPQLVVSDKGQLFWPYSEGQLVREPSRYPFKQASFPDTFGGYYPGACQMQFLAHYTDKGGVYFAAHDPVHGSKTIGGGGDGSQRVRLHLDTFCGSDNHAEYRGDFDYVVVAFHGDWMDAAAIYRGWISRDAPALRTKPSLPGWVSESPVVVIYPVRGSGDITAEPNCYFPYENAMPHVRALAEKFDGKVLCHLMRWDGNAPWAPPYCWPPLGGAELLARFRDQLHAEGHRLGVYCSGTFWTLKSKINDYSTEERFEREGLLRFMTRGPKGESKQLQCGQIREGFGLCVSERWARELLRQQVKDIAAAGIDFVQFFDQNLGGASLLCYSREHQHPSTPGRWQTERMTSLLDEMSADIKQSGSEMIMGTECAAAEPYLNGLPFNDLRAGFCIGAGGMPVPAYAFVFHEWCENFMGNECDNSKRIDCERSPENLLWRLSYSFNAGALLSVTLRDYGVIDWGAAADWSSKPPDQEAVTTLIRNLNHMRRKYPEFLQKGKMLKPLMGIECGEYILHLPDRDEPLASLAHSSWEAPDGTRAQFITNFLPRPQTATCQLTGGMGAKLDGKTLRGRFTLDLPPLSALALEVVE